jgi:hypothetical protein
MPLSLIKRGENLFNRTRDAAMRQGGGRLPWPAGGRATFAFAGHNRPQETLASRHFLGFNLNKVG